MISGELANAVYVSRSSIFRLLNRMNLSSDAELKLLIKNELAQRIDVYSDYQTIFKKYYNYIDASFKQTYLTQVAQKIIVCDVLYVYGTGNEQKLQADIIQTSLSSIGINTVIIFDEGEYNYLKNLFTNSDVLLLISYKGENEEALRILHDAQMHSVHTIAVTKTSMNSMVRLADDQVLVLTESISTPTQLTYEINTTFYLMFDQLFALVDQTIN